MKKATQTTLNAAIDRYKAAKTPEEQAEIRIEVNTHKRFLFSWDLKQAFNLAINEFTIRK